MDLETRTAFWEAAKWINVLVIIGGIILSLTSMVAIGVMLTGRVEEYALLGLILMLLFFGTPLYLKSFFKTIGFFTLITIVLYTIGIGLLGASF